MKITNAKAIVTKFMLTGLVAGAFAIAGTTQAHAQQFAVGVQFGNTGYVAVDRGYRYDPDRYRDEEFREHEAREAYARQQAYIAHERWEHEQRERARRYGRYDRDDRYDRYDRDDHYDRDRR
jgi:hypothetical protein